MEQKYKVGLVAGAFDVIHPGYIRMFADAKNVCEYLIVALHANPARERPMTKLPPILSMEERREILLAIRYVDEVIPYKTEAELFGIMVLRKPNVRILGDDYRLQVKRITGQSLKIPIYYHKRDHDWSTTRFKEKIAETIFRRRK